MKQSGEIRPPGFSPRRRSAAQDAAIDRDIAADPDTYELGAEGFKHLKRIGRPLVANPKVAVTIRCMPG